MTQEGRVRNRGRLKRRGTKNRREEREGIKITDGSRACDFSELGNSIGPSSRETTSVCGRLRA